MQQNRMWLIFSILAAVFAAATAILAKVGIENVDSTLATAIRTIVVLVMAWVMVFVTNKGFDLPTITTKSWIFLILSGLATGASWLCYFYALKIDPSTSAAWCLPSSLPSCSLARLLLGKQLWVQH